jgi:hypothetical protein
MAAVAAVSLVSLVSRRAAPNSTICPSLSRRRFFLLRRRRRCGAVTAAPVVASKGAGGAGENAEEVVGRERSNRAPKGLIGRFGPRPSRTPKLGLIGGEYPHGTNSYLPPARMFFPSQRLRMAAYAFAVFPCRLRRNEFRGDVREHRQGHAAAKDTKRHGRVRRPARRTSAILRQVPYSHLTRQLGRRPAA